MSDVNQSEDGAVREAGAQKSGVSRRHLVRAGLSAAPVLAALKSNTVLAGGDHTCIKPSTFSSLRAAQMKVSARREIKTDYECQSHGYWKNRDNGLPRDYKTTTRFLSTETGFTQNPAGVFTGKSLQQVLESGGNQGNTALARHVVAAFLTAKAYQNDPSRVMLTQAQCRAIWNGQGVWQPFAGTTWTLSQTMAYFDLVYGPSFL
ncbi:MAG: hypothetical protein GXD23_19740 [Comamonadaceae bacterium]|jgi:hypothetical protein|uniref:Uncharacterized protein n=1 Tax=Hydrogenophaga borbori TaxID=2294117 RepID=A0A372EN48_9BURK|nr:MULTISPECIES: hypothetical protein [Hydrogenophaga]NCT99607.1 hypothetical protein [Comamonadaceae bacterium]RFP81025.1 hypothetical protein DY262_04395 [Hydrogenophaga borbori]WQB85573.1 hypothetical protein SOM08_09675 [Hydrogenophaga sp. SNF1]